MRSAQQAAGASYAQMAIDRRSFHAVVRLPLDEVDLLLRLDRDLDGQVSDTELAASREKVGAYITKHLRVAADGAPLPLSVKKLAFWRDAGGSPYVEADAGGQAATRVATIAIRSDFLTELYPTHHTKGEVRLRDRAEAFVFQPGAVYERRLGPDWWMSALLVLAGLLVLGGLWLARRRHVLLAAAALLVASLAHADVIMSAPGLNATLKTMERLAREDRPDARFELGLEADALASLMNQEVESHGMQERELLDLALSRTKELNITIAYRRDKKKFFYDGAAFAAYLTEAPRGAHAAAAEFKLLSYQFYQSSATETAALVAAAAAKQRFLARYPAFEANAEVRLYLAVDYRDLHRRYLDAHDAASAAKYRGLARAECLRIGRLYPRTEQADAAKQLMQGLSPRQ
jgi:hypothetical protein